MYLDDILIFSTDLKEHREVVHEVLKRLEQNDLFLKPVSQPTRLRHKTNKVKAY